MIYSVTNTADNHPALPATKHDAHTVTGHANPAGAKHSEPAAAQPSGWLDLATAHLGGGGVFDVTPPRQQTAHTQQNQSDAQTQTANNSTPVANFDPAPFDAAARIESSTTAANGSVADSPTATNNSDSQSTQSQADTSVPQLPDWQNIVSQAMDTVSGALANSDSIVRHLEDEARIIKEIGDSHVRHDESVKAIERQEHAGQGSP